MLVANRVVLENMFREIEAWGVQRHAHNNDLVVNVGSNMEKGNLRKDLASGDDAGPAARGRREAVQYISKYVGKSRNGIPEIVVMKIEAALKKLVLGGEAKRDAATKILAEFSGELAAGKFPKAENAPGLATK